MDSKDVKRHKEEARNQIGDEYPHRDYIEDILDEILVVIGRLEERVEDLEGEIKNVKS